MKARVEFIAIIVLAPLKIFAATSTDSELLKVSSRALQRSGGDERPAKVQAAPGSRNVTYEDLINIVDVGASDDLDFEGIAVSPDRRFLAVETTRASIECNTTDSRWVALSLKDKDVVDLGPATDLYAQTEFGQQRLGVRVTERPVWLPDSQSFAFRAGHTGSTQIWRVWRNGRSREQLTHGDADVEAFSLSADGKRLLFSTQDWTTINKRRADEAAQGYLYDERFSPMLSFAPIESAAPRRYWIYDLGTRTQRLAIPAEEKEFRTLTTEAEQSNGKRWLRSSVDGRSAVWLEGANGRLDPQLPQKIAARHTGLGAVTVPCVSERCIGYFKGLWLDGDAVYFLRWVGAHDYGAIGLYSWHIGADEVKEIYRTDDLLQACAHTLRELICVQETAIHPARIVRVSLETGRAEVIYDPNPDFGLLRFGQVAPLTWKDGAGVEGFGHLVKPIGYRPGVKYPLIIVQYRSRGFLRGGVGDEFPIHVLAAHGFAVLSFHRPDDWETLARFQDDAERESEFWRNRRDRRRVLSVLRAGIEALDDMGVIDRTRVGISGLSDGANTAAFALIHVPREFAAAAVASTTWNPILHSIAGPLMGPQLQWLGLSDPNSPDSRAAWQDLSIALNAATVSTPLLIQVSDAELLPETQTVSALKGHGKAVEMHVFPGEFHIKSQPQHRLSVYRRSVQWFEFWLNGSEDLNPVDESQYVRWKLLRSRLTSVEH